MTVRILLVGATGYIGGTILTTLLARGGDVKITCLVRRQECARLLEQQLGVETVVADLDNAETVKKAAAKADVVINAANADHPEGAQALVDGLEERFQTQGKKGIIVHTSGTGALTDDARGEFASDKIYEDYDCAEIHAIPETYVHCSTNLVITRASERGVVKGFVVMPPLIYGRGTGLFNCSSVQIPAMIRATLRLGKAPYIGKGLGMWNGCHVQDLADFNIILMDDAMSEFPKAPTGDEGYYFTATDTYQWKNLAKELGELLYAKGAISDAEPYSVTDVEEEQALFGKWSGFAYASNSRSKAGKAYTLGWQPKTTGLFASMDTEYEAVIKEGTDQAPKVHFDELYGLGIISK